MNSELIQSYRKTLHKMRVQLLQIVFLSIIFVTYIRIVEKIKPDWPQMMINLHLVVYFISGLLLFYSLLYIFLYTVCVPFLMDSCMPFTSLKYSSISQIHGIIGISEIEENVKGCYWICSPFGRKYFVAWGK